jgi:hypothetical protein
MKTVAEWLKRHPGVNVLAFERHCDKSFGFGAWEEVCGFCLASHYFDGGPPEFCKFCRAPLRETHVSSDLPEITSRTYRLDWLLEELKQPEQKLPFIVREDSGEGV